MKKAALCSGCSLTTPPDVIVRCDLDGDAPLRVAPQQNGSSASSRRSLWARGRWTPSTRRTPKSLRAPARTGAEWDAQPSGLPAALPPQGRRVGLGRGLVQPRHQTDDGGVGRLRRRHQGHLPAQEAERQMAHMARHDPLTGPPERPSPLPRAADAGDRAGAARWRRLRPILPRPGSVQADQRHPRPSGRRQPAAHARAAAERRPARRRHGSAPGRRRIRRHPERNGCVAEAVALAERLLAAVQRRSISVAIRRASVSASGSHGRRTTGLTPIGCCRARIRRSTAPRPTVVAALACTGPGR